MKNLRSASTLALPLLLWACQGEPQGSQLASGSVPGGIRARLELGQSYDSDRAKWGNTACITGDPFKEDLGSTAGLVYSRDMSYDETLKTISGELSVGVSFPSISVDGKADYASSNSASEFRETHTLSYRYETRNKFKTGSHRLTDTGSRYSQEGPTKLRDRCKDEFVNEIMYGASYIATMSVEYKNKEDKEKFGGSLKANILDGKVTVEGKLAVASSDEKKSVKIKLNATQEGGDPRLLSKVLTPDIASCDAANLAPCIEGFRALIEYGRSMTDQIKDETDLVVLSYNTESYADTGMEELVADEDDQADIDTTVARFDIEIALEKTRQDLARAGFVAANYATSMSEQQRTLMPIAQMNLKKNKALLSKALEFCYKNPYSEMGSNGRSYVPCTENYRDIKMKLEAIPTEVLSIPTPNNSVPSDTNPQTAVS